MNQCLAVFLALLVLLQSFSREVLVLDFALRQARITEQYCVNKARPQLGCNGRFHLRQQLMRRDNADKKAPSGQIKPKFEALPVAAGRPALPHRLSAGRATCRRLAGQAPGQIAGREVFRPPVV